MNKVACLSDKDRQELFRGTARKMGINEAIIEKDFWVCWTLLGYREDEPWAERSTSGQEKFNQEANERALAFLHKTFAPALRIGFADILGKDAEISVDDEQNVFFHYPKSFSNNAILQAIRLEIGPLAAWVPSENRIIKSYAAEKYPAVFGNPETSVRTVMAKRTFWEKATILHQEAHRDTKRSLPVRYSRHYYDLYSMLQERQHHRVRVFNTFYSNLDT